MKFHGLLTARHLLAYILLHNIILVLWDAFAIIMEKVHGRHRGGDDKLREKELLYKIGQI